MKVKIKEYSLPQLTTNFTLAMPADAVLLQVHNFGGLWPTLLAMLFGPDYDNCVQRHFELHGSDQEFDNNKLPGYTKYIGSFALSGGARVYHLFEILNK